MCACVPVVVKEGCVATAFVLVEDVDLGLEFLIGLDGTRGTDHLTALHVVSLDTAQQYANIVTRLASHPSE